MNTLSIKLGPKKKVLNKLRGTEGFIARDEYANGEDEVKYANEIGTMFGFRLVAEE